MKSKIDLINLLEEKKRRNKDRQIVRRFDMLYGWQKEFIESTSTHFESCLCAANQIGKTFTGTYIDAVHLTGEYPDNWIGHKFEFPPVVWCLGYSMEKTRDLLQTAIFGKYIAGAGWDGGIIPADKIISHEAAGGTPNAMRTVRVRHKLGVSVVQFWSYSQGQHAIMGDVVDWFHVDEEPKDAKIRPQVLTRTVNGDKGRGGRGIYTFTPENGKTELVLKFMEDPSPSQFFMMKGWSDAPHMTEEKRERLLQQYPTHQRDMRTKGIPMLGHGRIYDIGEEYITCDSFDIPAHFFVIDGMDFGWEHPQAQVQLAWDKDNDEFFVTRAWKKSQVSPDIAWGSTKSWSKDVPTAWPQDGLQTEKGSGKQQKQYYVDAGFNMLSNHATWPDGGNGVEAGIFEIRDLMQKGKFRIFAGLRDVFDEINQYHRDEHGKIVKSRDDLLDAIRYAYMMRRYAKSYGTIGKQKQIDISECYEPAVNYW